MHLHSRINMCRYYLFRCWHRLYCHLCSRSLWWIHNRLHDIHVYWRFPILYRRNEGKLIWTEEHFCSHIGLFFHTLFSSYKQVFYRERLNGYYGVSVFIIANFLSSFPFLAAITLSTGTITYYLVKFRTGFSHYVYFSLNIFLCISVIESLMMVVASLVPNFLMGIITGAGIMVSRYISSNFDHLRFCFHSSLGIIFNWMVVYAGHPDDDFRVLPLTAGSSQAILALPDFISQLWLMVDTGNTLWTYHVCFFTLADIKSCNCCKIFFHKAPYQAGVTCDLMY